MTELTMLDFEETISTVNTKAKELINEYKLMDSIDNIPIIFFVYDLEQKKIVYVNRQVTTLLGYTVKYLLNLDTSELKKVIVVKGEVESLFFNDKGELDYNETAIKVKHKKGSYKWLLLNKIPFNNDVSGNISQLLISATDITSQKKNERYLNALMRINKHVEARERKLKIASIIQGQEEERKRISMDMHDGIGQMLTAIKFSVAELSYNKSNYNQTKKPSDYEKKIEEINGLVKMAINEVRKISSDIGPFGLYRLGLLATIKKMGDDIERSTGVNVSLVNCNIDSDYRFSSKVELNVYRIIQESINNALKHAHASRITINVAVQNKLLKLEVEDNGIGFKVIKHKKEKSTVKNGIGLLSMNERAELLEGKLYIKSTKKGTKVSLDVPIDEVMN